ncbi:MAG: hypothetical protein ACTSU2_00215 [Promethearchaeota archaeon]
MENMPIKNNSNFFLYSNQIKHIERMLNRLGLKAPAHKEDYSLFLDAFRKPGAGLRGYKISFFFGLDLVKSALAYLLFKLTHEWTPIDDKDLNTRVTEIANEMEIWKIEEPVEFKPDYSESQKKEIKERIKRIIERDPKYFIEILKENYNKNNNNNNNNKDHDKNNNKNLNLEGAIRIITNAEIEEVYEEIDKIWQSVTLPLREKYLQWIITEKMRKELMYAFFSAVFKYYDWAALENIVQNQFRDLIASATADSTSTSTFKEELNNLKKELDNPEADIMHISIKNIIELSKSILAQNDPSKIKITIPPKLLIFLNEPDRTKKELLKILNEFDVNKKNKKTPLELVNSTIKPYFIKDSDHITFSHKMAKDFRKLGKFLLENFFPLVLHDYFNKNNETLIEETDFPKILNTILYNDKNIFNYISELKGINLYSLITDDPDEQNELNKPENRDVDELIELFFIFIGLNFFMVPVDYAWKLTYLLILEIMSPEINYINNFLKDNNDLIKNYYESMNNLVNNWLTQTANTNNLKINTFSDKSIFKTKADLLLKDGTHIIKYGYGNSKKVSRNYALKKLLNELNERGLWKSTKRSKRDKFLEKLAKNPEKAIYWLITELERNEYTCVLNKNEENLENLFKFNVTLKITSKNGESFHFEASASDENRTASKKKAFEKLLKENNVERFLKDE